MCNRIRNIMLEYKLIVMAISKKSNKWWPPVLIFTSTITGWLLHTVIEILHIEKN